MHNLVVDIGNTHSKAAVFNDRTLVHHQIFKEIVSDDLIQIIRKYNIVNSTVSSVNADLEELVPLLEENTRYIEFSTAIHTGVENNYKTPSTLGLDRWAKVIAAYYLYPAQNCMIIDAGTCITYDFLSSRGVYYGGSISLGINMRFKALNYYTRRLPLVKWNSEKENIPFGADTETAIENGVLKGVMYEVEGFIAGQLKENEELKVLLTGGDAVFLWGQLKKSIFAPQIVNDPYLVLKGLNEVIALEYVQKN